MTSKDDRPGDAAELRRRAEEMARGQAAQAPEKMDALSPEETRRTFHELSVHQIELEMQNEELRRAQAELDAERARYFDLYDLAPAGYCTVSEQGLILEANLTAAGLLGVGRGALLQQPITRFILKEDQDIYYLHRKLLFATGEPQERELRMVRRDGTAFWAHLAATAAEDASGAPVCRLVMSEIPEREQAAEALRESEERYRRVSSAISDVAYACCLAEAGGYRIDWLTGATERITGYSADELKAKRCWDSLVIEEDRPLFDEHVVGLAPDSSGSCELRVRHKDGSVRWLASSAECVLSSEVPHTPRIYGGLVDVTARKRVEDALRESEGRYRSVFEQSGDLILLLELRDGLPLILDANQAALRAHGYSRVEMVGQPISVIQPDITPELVAERTSLVAAGKPLYLRHRRKDGSTFEVESVARRARVGAQDVVLAVARDITERNRVETELRASRQRLALHVQATPLAVIEFGVDGRVTQWNPGAVAVFGFSREEAVGQHWRFLVPRSAWGTLDGRFCALVAQRGGRRSTNENLTKDGRTLTCEWFNTPLTDGDGNAIGVASLVIDITERKRAEEALRQSEEKYRTVADFTYDWEYWISPTREMRYVSPSCQRITGYSAEQFVSDSGFLSRIIHPDDQIAYERHLCEELAADYNPGLVEIEFRVIASDGGVRWIAHGCRSVFGAEGAWLGRRASNRDITERRRAEEEHERLQARLAQAQKMESIGRLAGGVAHDFNNLLTVISGYSQLLLDKLCAGDPLRAGLEEIHKAGGRAAGLTRQLLAFSRKQVLEPRVLDLNHLLGGMQSMLERLVGEAVEVRVALNAQSGAVHADPNQLEQVIMNLAVNARDAMPGGGRLLIETAVVEWDQSYVRSHPEARAGRYVMLAVSDNGSGMDEETKKRIFEPFFTTKGAGQGTGLGLSMIQGIVAQSGGYIDVYSEPGQGSIFKIYLPALAEAAVEAGRPAAVPALGGKETVLVVEDQAEVREYAVAVLKAYGYRVIKAENAGAALMLCERERGSIHLVLTDVVMPNVSGQELVARLEKLRTGIKVLFMSGYTDEVIVHQGMLEEGREFIQKPFSPEALAGKVRAVLGPPAPVPRILVADDEAGVRGFLRAALEEGGYEVAEAADGKQALQQARAGDVDLVITDLVMPKQEGVETIQALRKEMPGIGIIAITGKFEGPYLKMVEMLGADVVLTKPVGDKLLLAKVAEVLKPGR